MATPHEVGCPATLTEDDHVHQCGRSNMNNITHLDRHSGDHTCIICDHTWETGTPADDAGILPRCPVCQHWPAPHRQPCAGIVGVDRNGVQVLCGCDGADYGLQARLMFIESDLTQLAHAGALAARGGIRTADALNEIIQQLADLTTRINVLEGRTAHLGNAD